MELFHQKVSGAEIDSYTFGYAFNWWGRVAKNEIDLMQGSFELLVIVNKINLFETRSHWGYWVVELIQWNEKQKECISE